MKNTIHTTRASHVCIRWLMLTIFSLGSIQSPCFAQNSKDVKKAALNQDIGRLLEIYEKAGKSNEAYLQGEVRSAPINMNNPALIEAMVTSLKSGYKGIRISVATAFGKMNDPRVIDPVIALLFDKNGDVKYSVRNALAETK